MLPHSSSQTQSSITTAFRTPPAHSTETSRSFELDLSSRKEKKSSSATTQSVKTTMSGKTSSGPSSRKESVLAKFASSIVSMEKNRSPFVTRSFRRSSFLTDRDTKREYQFQARTSPGPKENFSASSLDSNPPTLPNEVPSVQSFPMSTISCPVSPSTFELLQIERLSTIVSRVSNPPGPSSRGKEPKSKSSSRLFRFNLTLTQSFNAL